MSRYPNASRYDRNSLGISGTRRCIVREFTYRIANIMQPHARDRLPSAPPPGTLAAGHGNSGQGHDGARVVLVHSVVSAVHVAEILEHLLYQERQRGARRETRRAARAEAAAAVQRHPAACGRDERGRVTTEPALGIEGRGALQLRSCRGWSTLSETRAVLSVTQLLWGGVQDKKTRRLGMPSHVPPQHVQALDVGATEQLNEGGERGQEPVHHRSVGSQQQADMAEQLLVLVRGLIELALQLADEPVGRGARPGSPAKRLSRSHHARTARRPGDFEPA